MKEYISEAEALEDMPTPQERFELVELLRTTVRRQSIVDQLNNRLEAAKNASTGDTINCAFCGTEIIKTTYHKTFCSNSKTHGKNNCKDRFHNVLRYHTDPAFAARLDAFSKR